MGSDAPNLKKRLSRSKFLRQPVVGITPDARDGIVSVAVAEDFQIRRSLAQFKDKSRFAETIEHRFYERIIGVVPRLEQQHRTRGDERKHLLILEGRAARPADGLVESRTQAAGSRRITEYVGEIRTQP